MPTLRRLALLAVGSASAVPFMVPPDRFASPATSLHETRMTTTLDTDTLPREDALAALRGEIVADLGFRSRRDKVASSLYRGSFS